MPRSTERPGRIRALVAAALGATLAIAVAAPAHAAPPYATEASIDSVAFVETTIRSGLAAELTGTWSLPDRPTSPAGLELPLPEGLVGVVDAFPLLDPDGAAMGRCTVDAGLLLCDFDPAYLDANPIGLRGSFSIWVEVGTQVTTPTQVTYDLGDASTTVTVVPPADPCPAPCVFEGVRTTKSGQLQANGSTILWTIAVPAPVAGMAGGELVEIVDAPGPGHTIVPGSLRLLQSAQVGVGPRGTPEPIDFQPATVPFVPLPDGSGGSFVAEASTFYRVQLTTAITDGGAQQAYANGARVTVAGTVTEVDATEVRLFGGSGTGLGTGVGAFTITKDVVGLEGLDDIAFTGSYVVTAPDGTTTPGTFEVSDGATWESPEFVRGSTVRLSETAPSAPASVVWADPVFSQNDFALAGATVTAVSLTNAATLATGTFQAAKEITGTGAALVPRDAAFALRYSHPAGAGYAAGEGELVLPADGTPVTSPALPRGAVLTLSEAAPTAVGGATWGTATVSPATITIGADPAATVTVTNTIASTPPTSPPTTPPATATPTSTPRHELPRTGGDAGHAALIGGLVLLLGGGVALAARSRTRADVDV